MLKRLTRFVSSIEDLNTKMFWSVAVIVAIITVVSAVTTFLEGIDRICTISLILGVIAIFLLTLVAKKFGCVGLCYMGVCLIVNEVLIPINYFTGGGLMSGMPMYFVAGITLCTFAMKNWQKRVMGTVSSVTFLACLLAEFVKPELVTPMPREGVFLDVAVCMVLVGSGLFMICLNVFMAYEEEREKAEQLNAKLEFSCTHDYLTNMPNRRAFFEFGEKMNIKGSYFIVMYDVDNFKSVNDTYGHPFGDKVLETFAKIMEDEVSGHKNEIAARYGGEEFIMILSEKDRDEAFRRADHVRQRLTECKWEPYPNLIISTSGGFATCNMNNGPDSLSRAISRADKRLYSAKHDGKNRVRPVD